MKRTPFFPDVYQRGDTVVFTDRMPVYAGKRAIVRSISRTTGSLSVELLEDVSEAIRKGSRFVVPQYDVKKGAA